MREAYESYDSPIGLLHLVVDDTGLKKVFLLTESWEKYLESTGSIPRDSKKCQAALQQLEEYFCGKRRIFNMPLSIEGTPFYKQVWKELISIPYGETRTYSEIAHALGKPNACRAVGQANRNNPLPIIIPCHRVIGKAGSMTGYLGNNTEIKRILLDLEKRSEKI